MAKIIALILEKATDFGGASSVWWGLALLKDREGNPLVEIQTFEKFCPSSETRLVLGMVIEPPPGNYKRGVIFCSPILQAELGGELGILQSCVDKLRLGVWDYLFFTDKGEAQGFCRAQGSDRFIYMPPILARTLPHPSAVEDRRGIFCGGMSRANKNYLNQILAWVVSGTSEELYTMGDEKRNFYTAYARVLFRRTWRDLGFIESYEEYYRRLREFKLGLQVSISESFCYLVQEMGLLKIPCLVSPTIGWYSGSTLDTCCRVEDVGDIDRIAYQLRRLLENESIYEMACEEAYEVSEKVRLKNIGEATEILRGLVEN